MFFAWWFLVLAGFSGAVGVVAGPVGPGGGHKPGEFIGHGWIGEAFDGL